MKRQLAMLVLAAMTTPVVAQWISLPTPGIPRTAGGAPDLSAPAPRAADGNPDLSGLWYPVEVTGDLLDPANAQEWARLLMAEREARFLQDAPRFRCLPSGPGFITLSGSNFGTRRIVQHPDLIAILNADLTYRQIFMDGRELEPEPYPIWTGYSVGHWEGDTLVVDSNGYNDKTWLHARGLPHSDSLRITERYHRPNFGRLAVYSRAVTDPRQLPLARPEAAPLLAAERRNRQQIFSASERDGAQRFNAPCPLAQPASAPRHESRRRRPRAGRPPTY